MSIQEETVDSVNEYLSNNHDKTDFDLSFFIINTVIYHHCPDFNKDKFKEHTCIRISAIEDAIFIFLCTHVVQFPDNKFIEIHVSIKKDCFSNTLSKSCEDYYSDWMKINIDNRINMNDKFEIVVVIK